MTQYVLRAYCFGYNDENFYICGTRISDVFDNRDDADAAYRKAQLAYLRDIDLGEHEKFFNGDDAYIRKMAAFIQDKTGNNILEDEGYVSLGSDAHTEMSDDDLFEFGELGELHAFKLIAFDDEPVFYALWNSVAEKYCMTFDEGYEGPVYGASLDEALKLLDDHDIQLDWEGFEMQGTLEDLSDNPNVLRQFIDSVDEFEYDEEGNVLRFEYADTRDVVALNALLREPIFQVRELTVDEIRQIEKESGSYGGGPGYVEPMSFTDGCGFILLKWTAIFLAVPIAITIASCLFGSCDSVMATFGSAVWTFVKWLALFIIGAAVIIYGIFKLGGSREKNGGRND